MKHLEHLGITWLIDLDGTVTVHNAHLHDGDSLLPGVKDLWSRIGSEDYVIILTARDDRYRATTLQFLNDHGLRNDLLVMGLPKGARILVNDRKPDGVPTAFSINLERDQGPIQVLELIKNGI